MEYVLAVTDDIVKAVVSSSGFLSASAFPLSSLLEHAVFIERHLAEGNPYYRQLIPYVAVLRQGMVFTTRRLRKQSEQRLHDLLSCGVGGHINPCDDKGLNVVLNAALREMHEELSLCPFPADELRHSGYIYDSSNAVSRDHLGCVYILNTTDNVLVKETDKMHGDFMHPSDLRANFHKLESWSQLILPELESRSLNLPPRA